MRPDQARDPVERFFEHVLLTTGCDYWTGRIDKHGYGKFRIGSMTDGSRTTIGAHRFAWITAYGEIPEGMGVLHHCDNPRCVKPSHLYIGTPADNGRDVRERRRNPKARQTHCIRGHAFTPENTIVKPNGTRKCRECGNLRRRKPGAKVGNAKLDPQDVIEIKEALDCGIGRSLLASRYGVTVGAIHHIAQGITWAHLER